MELYVWHAPRDVTAEEAAALVEAWKASGAGPDAAPFEPNDDVRWFSREVNDDAPPVWAPDAEPKKGPHPDRVVVVPIPQDRARETFELVYSLAVKYDLVVYDPQRATVNLPMAEMSAYASATFWPRGAIRAGVAGLAGAAIAIIAWVVGIPILSGMAVVVGVLLFFLAVWTLVHEAQIRLRAR